MYSHEKINQLIEEKVFGSECVWFSFVNGESTEGDHGANPHLKVACYDSESYMEYDDLPDYYNEIGQAFYVAERLQLTVTPGYDGRWRAFRANASGSTGDTKWIGTTNNQIWVESDQASEAICLAALKILNIKIDEEIS